MRWQIWIDRGGTFTDCIGRDPRDGAIHVAKVLSSDRAPLEGIRTLLGLAADAPIPPVDVRMGTTLATNALLERRGVDCGLVTTQGFGDLLEIGDQTRPELFALEIRKPSMLYREVLELPARVDAEGVILERPDEEATREALQAMRARGLRSVAIVFLHAYRAPELEQHVGRLAREAGFDHVALSHEVASEIGMVARGGTTVVDAYLTPLIRDYLRTLLAELPGSSLRIMQSSGGLTDAARFRARDAILSGPAAGVVACAHVARRAGVEQAIGFDMGGTSTDVSRSAGEPERAYETQIGGVQLRAPVMDIHTVAAGGGSICRYDGHKLSVGPQSAGADPGPLCYGRAGATELTLTDVNLMLGRILPDRFPFALRKAPVEQALQAIVERLHARGDTRGALEVAEGFFRIAVESMAEAIRKISVARGHDVREHALVVFGGAGGQHACAVANRLGVRRVVFHPFAGVLSAYGMGVADVSVHDEQDAGRFELDATADARLAPLFETLEARGLGSLQADGWQRSELRIIRRVDLRYRGTESALTVDHTPHAALREEFEAVHRRRFGYARRTRPIEVVAVRVEVVAHARQDPEAPPPRRTRPAEPLASTSCYLDGRMRRDVPVYAREQLAEGQRIAGPAVVIEDTGTIVVDPEFELCVASGLVVLDRVGTAASAVVATAQVDPVQLEVFNNLYMSIAEQMGVVLQRTALSTNIRERLDFSCAVFDREGGLVANAPHIPVHLGAMSESVRAIVHAHPEPREGDVFATNDPAAGGSHLPDVTVVTPVFHEGELTFFTASRGHHADIGGITPGSMPPFSQSLQEEGVVLRGVRIVRDGQLDEIGLRRMLEGGPYPARNPDQNLADLEAQVAANRTGASLLEGLVSRYGVEIVRAYMGHVQDNAAAMVEEAIAMLPDGEHGFEDTLDDGTLIRVCFTVRGRHMHVDFTGSSAQVASNLNAPRAVTVAAVLYVLRCLVGTPVPLNSGCFRPVTLSVPEGSVLAPSAGAAVAAGNVETSQRVVDVLLGALGKVAAAQGTMNNLTFGDASFGYYETIAGGAGAGPGFDGASAVHTHMTNTRITDPEVLEARYPVRLLQFAVRRGSGGAGRYRGGDGVVREIQALRPLSVSILSERRHTRPFGLHGGEPGAAGRNLKDAREQPGRAEFQLRSGARVRVETPGGGGYGPVPARPGSPKEERHATKSRRE